MIEIVPYVEVNGSRTVPDDLVKGFFRQMVADGTAHIVFYNGNVKTDQDFLDTMKSTDNFPSFILVDGKIGGLGWLNGVVGNYAFSHFCFLKHAWGKDTAEMGKAIINYWLSLPGVEGPFLDVLIGLIPDFNQHATTFAQKMGYVRIGVIPKMAHNAYAGESVGMTVLYRVR